MRGRNCVKRSRKLGNASRRATIGSGPSLAPPANWNERGHKERMSCPRLEAEGGSTVWWHRLWCAECRAAHSADGVIARGVAQWQAEPIPADSLSRTLAALGMPAGQ